MWPASWLVGRQSKEAWACRKEHGICEKWKLWFALSVCHRKSFRHMLVNFPVSVTDSWAKHLKLGKLYLSSRSLQLQILMMVKAWTNRAAHNMVARKQRERERHTERQRDRERGNERRDCAIGLPLCAFPVTWAPSLYGGGRSSQPN